MDRITITLPIPHKSLRPNARTHWRAKLKPKREAREAGYFAAIVALNRRTPPNWRTHHKSCTFHGCSKPHQARGLCSTHYKQWRDGRPLSPIVNNRWSDQEIQFLREWYARTPLKNRMKLANLAITLGRSKANVCRKARELGLTDKSRKGIRKDRRVFKGDKDAWRAHISEARKSHIAANGHPRGMLGKHHSEATRFHLSMFHRMRSVSMPESKKSEQSTKALKTRLENQGTLAYPRQNVRWKQGWREVGGQRIYARSMWEANVARYLQFLVGHKSEIRKWEHEPDTFWFEGIKRGVRSYLPDFKVWPIREEEPAYYIEVKGWMDSRSKTKLKRMKKYHPHVKIELIDSKRYAALMRTVAGLIPDWEYGARDRRAA